MANKPVKIGSKGWNSKNLKEACDAIREAVTNSGDLFNCQITKPTVNSFWVSLEVNNTDHQDTPETPSLSELAYLAVRMKLGIFTPDSGHRQIFDMGDMPFKIHGSGKDIMLFFAKNQSTSDWDNTLLTDGARKKFNKFFAALPEIVEMVKTHDPELLAEVERYNAHKFLNASTMESIPYPKRAKVFMDSEDLWNYDPKRKTFTLNESFEGDGVGNKMTSRQAAELLKKKFTDYLTTGRRKERETKITEGCGMSKHWALAQIGINQVGSKNFIEITAEAAKQIYEQAILDTREQKQPQGAWLKLALENLRAELSMNKEDFANHKRSGSYAVRY